MIDVNSEIISKATKILIKYPLCPSCLGRQFSSLLRGFTNKERGMSILTVLLMNLQEKIISEDKEARDLLNTIMRSFPQEFRQTIESMGISYKNNEKCYICENLISKTDDIAKEATKILEELKAESFVVGISNDDEYVRREDEVWRSFSLCGIESIRNELKREIGKRIQELSRIPVDFKNPGVMLIIDIKKHIINYVSNPIIIRGHYLKLGRNISQSIWVTPKKTKLYQLSVEEASNVCVDYLQGSQVILHAAGREDVDVRMLGSGRPVSIEIKNPKRRNVNLETLEYCLNSRNNWVKFSLSEKINREESRKIKLSDKLHGKIYRALIYSEQPFSSEEIKMLESFFKNKLIKQRTPTRVLKRRADIVRTKRVYWTKPRKLFDRWMEVFIATEGGLYIKELITGDNGRTNPSFSSVLNKKIDVLELDVLIIFDQANVVQ